MTEWTPTARATLERCLDQQRDRFAADGTEADEVIADLRDHVEREAEARNLSIVTEADALRILAQVDPVLLEPPDLRTADSAQPDQPEPRASTPPNPAAPASANSGTISPSRPTPEGPAADGANPATPTTRNQTLAHRCWLGVRVVLGVLLPLGTLLFEWLMRPSASDLLDPIPTPFHIGLILLVPLTQAIGIGWLERSARPLPRWFPWLLSASLGISAAYAIAYSPITPLATIGILFYGLGLVPLAPLVSWITGLQLRSRARRRAREQQVPWPRHTWIASVAAMLLLGALVLPEFLTLRALRRAVDAETADERQSAVRLLRSWGNHETLLRACYGIRNRLWDNPLHPFGIASLPADTVQTLYFRVTGYAFTETRPPLGSLRGVGREVFEDFEWDRALGGEAVAGHVAGLSLQSSRLDVTGNSQDGWGYTEWILEFRNDHGSRQREARAEIQLPPGGVVSRLTLWVHGEEREAAFAGRGEVRAAYQQVAVAQRRDPVLVTTSGPDRVLLQCFPVPAQGGTMKVRLGITAPLTPLGAGEVAVVWPRLVEGNFALAEALNHHLWLETPQRILNPPSPSGTNAGPTNRVSMQIPATQGSRAFPTFRLERRAEATSDWALDDRTTPKAAVRQRLLSQTTTSRGRLAIVVDGGRTGRDGWQALHRLLASTRARGDLRLWVSTADGTREAAAIHNGPFQSAIGAMDRSTPDFVGGQDPIPALETAWDWASGQPDGTVLWIHGTVPVLLGDPQSIAQRLQRGEADGARVIDLQAINGPNLLARDWSPHSLYQPLPRLGSLDEDLKRFLETWSGGIPQWQWRLERSEHPDRVNAIVQTPATSGAPGGVSHATAANSGASRHLVRLWARERIEHLRRQRKIADTVAVAELWQLVTPVSGAVVLETKAQYQAAGLTPVAPLTTPAIVPEPETWTLLILGVGVLALWNRRQRHPTVQEHPGANGR